MKIALLIPSLKLGGSERNIVLLGESLVNLGCTAELWLTGINDREIPTGLTVVPLSGRDQVSSRPLQILRRIRAIRNETARFGPEVIISFLESSSIPAAIAGLITRVPTIVSVRGSPKQFNWFYRAMAFSLYRTVFAVVAPSREAAAYLATRFRLTNTCSIPNICQPAETTYVADERKNEGPLIAIGRLVSGKRVEDVIAASDLIFPDRELLIVGDGPERSKLEQIASKSRNRVRFLGAQPQEMVTKLLVDACLLVSMSESECWPNVIAEALVLGTPVVARDCDFGPREMIADGRNGFLIRGNLTEENAARIRRAVRELPTYLSLCQAATRSRSEWAVDRVRSLWMSLIAGKTQ